MWEVTKYKCFVTVFKQGFQVSVLEYSFLYFLLLTFSKQARHFWFETVDGSFYFPALRAFEHQTDLSLNNNALKAILMVYQSPKIIISKDMKEVTPYNLCIIYSVIGVTVGHFFIGLFC